MKEKKLQLFVDIVANYFKQFGSEEIVIDTPYLLESSTPKVLDYTGLIGISGAYQGVVYFTSSQDLLTSIMDNIEETDKSESNYMDLVGEVANTISGNARTEFGPEFHISVPVVFKGAPNSINLPKNERSFNIPVTWKAQEGEIVVYL